MKTLTAVLALMMLAGTAMAESYTRQRIGNFDYTTGSDGYSGTGQQIGNFYYYNDNQGNHITEQRIGDFTYTTNNPTPSYEYKPPTVQWNNPYGN